MIPAFQYRFPGIIWKVKPDPLSSLIALEIRHAEHKNRVSFTCIDTATKSILFENFQTEEEWFTGLDELYDDKLYLHGYVSETSPLHKGIICIEASSGRVLWQSFADTLFTVTNEGVQVFDPRIEPQTLHLLDSYTGSRKQAVPTSRTEASVFFPEEKDQHSPAYSLINQLTGQNPVGMIEYLTHDSLEIISYHIREAAGISNYLLILKNSSILAMETLCEQAKGFGSDTFFICNRQLIFIKNKCEFVIYSL